MRWRESGMRRGWLAYGALLLAISGIAWSALFIRWSGVPGPSSAFYRVFIAGLVLVPWKILARPLPRPAAANRRPVLLALGAGFFFALDLACYNTAVMRTAATTATLLGNNAPIFVGLGTWLVFGRVPPRRFWIGLGLALTGAAIVMVSTASPQSGVRGDLMGAFLAIAAAAFFAAYLLVIERVREEMDTLTLSTIAIVGSVLTLLLVVCGPRCTALGIPGSDMGGPPGPGAHLAARRLPRSHVRARASARYGDVRRPSRAGAAHGDPRGAAARRSPQQRLPRRRRAGPGWNLHRRRRNPAAVRG